MTRKVSPARVRRIAAIDFDPVDLPKVMSSDEFRLQAGQVYTQVQTAARLIKLSPEEMVGAIRAGEAEHLVAALENLNAAVSWVEDLRSLLACARARVAVALSKADAAGDL